MAICVDPLVGQDPICDSTTRNTGDVPVVVVRSRAMGGAGWRSTGPNRAGVGAPSRPSLFSEPFWIRKDLRPLIQACIRDNTRGLLCGHQLSEMVTVNVPIIQASSSGRPGSHSGLGIEATYWSKNTGCPQDQGRVRRLSTSPQLPDPAPRSPPCNPDVGPAMAPVTNP